MYGMIEYFKNYEILDYGFEKGMMKDKPVRKKSYSQDLAYAFLKFGVIL